MCVYIRELCVYLYIIIMLCCQFGSPWPALAIRLYCQSLLAGLQGYTQYQHRTVVYSMQPIAGHPAFACPCEWVHRCMSLISSSLLLQQCPAYLVHLTWIIFMMGSRWLYSSCFVGCCLQDLFNIAHSILV